MMGWGVGIKFVDPVCVWKGMLVNVSGLIGVCWTGPFVNVADWALKMELEPSLNVQIGSVCKFMYVSESTVELLGVGDTQEEIQKNVGVQLAFTGPVI